MKASIRLDDDERNTLLDYYRRHPDPAVRLRAHIVLLLADGRPWATLVAVLYCSSRTIARWQARFLQGRVDAVLGEAPGPRPRLTARWLAALLAWVTTKAPGDFGLLRRRWCCAALALVLTREHDLR